MTHRPLTRSKAQLDKLPIDVLSIIVGAAVVSIFAQITVPFYPVPMTLQTLAVISVGLMLGSKRGAGSILMYLAAGTAGLPVFASGGSTFALAGPTAGFLLGFVMMAWLAGKLAENSKSFSPVTKVVLAVFVAAIVYVPGLLWPVLATRVFGHEMPWATTSPSTLWAHWVSPFLLGDATKAVLAVMLYFAGLKLRRRID